MTEGERWARALLEELRAARYTPRAWIRFLERSFQRAAGQHRSRPRAVRETLALGGIGLAAWLGVGLAGRPALAAAGAAWWLGVVVMLDWHLGMLERPDGRPLDRLGLPNALSLLRAGLVPALPVLSPTALAVALATAQASDVLDGRLARKRNEVSRLGFWIDGAADTSLVAVAAVALALDAHIGVWLAALVLTRAATPWVLLGIAYFALAGPPPRAGYVPGHVPALALHAGLVVSALGLPGGSALLAVGAAGGLATFAATLIRSLAVLRRAPAPTS